MFARRLRVRAGSQLRNAERADRRLAPAAAARRRTRPVGPSPRATSRDSFVKRPREAHSLPRSFPFSTALVRRIVRVRAVFSVLLRRARSARLCVLRSVVENASRSRWSCVSFQTRPDRLHPARLTNHRAPAASCARRLSTSVRENQRPRAMTPPIRRVFAIARRGSASSSTRSAF